MYRWVIDDLNSNRMRSRVIMSVDKVIGYAFLYPATGFSDRNFASFGFLDPVAANRERSILLLDWAIAECTKEGRKEKFLQIATEIIEHNRKAYRTLLDNGSIPKLPEV